MIKKYKHTLQKPLICFTTSILLISNIFWTTQSMALGGFDLSSDIIGRPINEYKIDIAPGVKEKQYSYENKDGKKVRLFVAEVDMKNPLVSIKAGTPKGGYAIGMQTVHGQAESISKDNQRVVAGVNGDYYNMATGEPFGIVYKDGKAVKPNQFSTWRFFAITKDGKAVIGDGAYYDAIKNNIKEAIGGQAILVKDGKAFEMPVFNPGKNPRTAVGIKANGDVFFAAVDGRQEPYSTGIDAKDFTQLLIGLGAVTALDMDGGGSTTYVSREPGGDDLQLVNSPSNVSERKVANSWLVVSSARSDHIFNSALIEPSNTSFLPGSTINFKAIGRDSALASAPLPAYGLRWELPNSFYGTIDQNGRFISNGFGGEVEVLLKRNGSIVGKTLIELSSPDKLKFDTPVITVMPGSVINLNMSASYNERMVDIKPEDIEWLVPSGLGAVDEKGVLHVSANPFPCKITARIKKTGLSAEAFVVLGKFPKTLFSFEGGIGSWASAAVGRGENASVERSSIPSGPVRFGNDALKINFDFTGGQKQSVLGVYAGPVYGTLIPGSPTSIGMWVYAPQEAAGYWLRTAIIDGKGKLHNLDLTSSVPGIDWRGWKYVQADIPSGLPEPLYLHPYQAVRIMSSNSGVTGPMTKGSIYVDNIRAVYGNEVDDLYPPVIESVNIADKIFNNSPIPITAEIHDYEEDSHKSGIDWDKVLITVDGKEYSKKLGNLAYDEDGSILIPAQYYREGSHQVNIKVQDKFGNETTSMEFFMVKY